MVLSVSKMLWPLQGEMVEDFQSVKSSGMGHFLHWGVEYLPQKWERGELQVVPVQPFVIAHLSWLNANVAAETRGSRLICDLQR